MIGNFLKNRINALLRFDPKTAYYATALKDFHLKISFQIPSLEKHLHTQYFITFCAQGLDTIRRFETVDASTTINAHISATPATFIGLFLNKDIHQALKQGLIFEGDPEFLALLKQWFSDCQIDWAEILSNYLGDSFAHKMESMVHKLIPKGRKRVQDFCTNVGEYAVDEGLITPAPLLDPFLEAVDALRAGVERLEAKIG